MSVITPATAIKVAVVTVTGAGFVLADRYRLTERIASGGAGVVWRAADQVLQRQVAVKMLQPEYAAEAEARARFRAEARNASALCHAAVACVYDYGEDASHDVPFLVMELVDGPSLAAVLAAGPVGPARTTDLIAQVAAGLHAAHSAGVVHRDVKPANLLISPDGQVKITDFGIASAIRSEPVTSSGTLIGTPAYLAPERVSGSSATAKSDLYSLGIVGYECLAGAPPFRGSAVDVAEAHLHSPFPPLPPDVPAEVAGLVAALMAKNPANRPSSARAVAEMAAHLHVAITGGIARTGGAWSGPLPACTTVAEPVTLTDLRESDSPLAAAAASEQRLAGSWPRRGGMSRSLRAGLAVTAALAAVGLGGWQIGTSNAVRSPGSVVLRPPPPARAMVNAQELVGQPVGLVLGDIRQLGLQPRLVWVTNGGQAPGTVLSIQPGGSVPVGTIVVVTAAAQPVRQPSQSGGNGGGGNGGNDGGGGGTDGGGNDGGGGGGGGGH